MEYKSNQTDLEHCQCSLFQVLFFLHLDDTESLKSTDPVHTETIVMWVLVGIVVVAVLALVLTIVYFCRKMRILNIGKTTERRQPVSSPTDEVEPLALNGTVVDNHV